MKTFKTPVILAAAVVASFAPLRAQNAVPAATSPAASPAPTPISVTTSEQPSLMPETILPQPSASGTAATSGTGSLEEPPKKGTAEQLRQAIRIRELRTQLANEPAIQAQRTSAEKAKTDAGMRAALRNYYTLLYLKIEKIDPSLHDTVEGILYNKLYSLEQHNVRPTKLIEPITEVPGSRSEDHAPPEDADSGTTKKEASDSGDESTSPLDNY
ncbi:MAG: hypothetical protein WCP06_12050 [Verrucomicrobiota bacterium]